MSEETKKAIESIVKEAENDPVKRAFLAGLKAGDALSKISTDNKKE